jgi:hypothetical protein
MRGLLVALLAAPAVAAAGDVTQCGQAVGDGEVGELRAHLRCDPLTVGVHLAGGGRLRLNGFTITALLPRQGAGVEFDGMGRSAWGTVEGPGEIGGFGVGIAGGGGRLRIQDVVLRDNGWGLTHKAPRSIDLAGVVATGNGYGLTSRGGRMRGHDVEASDNTEAGVWTNSVTQFVRLHATRNRGKGGVFTAVARGAVTRLVDSDVSGNDGLGLGYDVLSTGHVRLVRTTCGRAARVRTGNGDVTTVTRPIRCGGQPLTARTRNAARRCSRSAAADRSTGTSGPADTLRRRGRCR